MKIEALGNERIDAFLNYCRRHRADIDDSFLYEEDLEIFKPDDENPTYISIDEYGQIKSAVSLMIDDYNRRGRRARFRIFHSEADDLDSYRILMEAVLRHREGLDKFYIFIPIVNKALAKTIESLQFTLERYSFVLVRGDQETGDLCLPEGYEIRPFVKGNDVKIWCKIRNEAFSKLLGNETPITPDMVAKLTESSDFIEGALMVMYHRDKPIGIIRGALDEYEGSSIMNIGPLAVIPEYQGKGLGRSLLRALLHFAREKSYTRTMLCVNGENERAKALYMSEGFKQIEGVACYNYDLRSYTNIN